MERLKRNEQPTPSTEYGDSNHQSNTGMQLLQVPERPPQSVSPQSSTTENMMTETRDDLLQGNMNEPYFDMVIFLVFARY